MPEPLPTLVDRFRAAWPPEAWSEVVVVAAVSGGSDSVAMWRLLLECREVGAGRLVLAHFNHKLRGAAADDDAAWVERLAKSSDCECVVGEAKGNLSSAEEPLREARYAFLQATAARLGARYVVTGHTFDDQAETVLHRVARGTSISGLAGIRRTRPLGGATLLRPLLSFRRDEIVTWLDGLGQAYRTDATNAEPRYLRNRLRHDLLPWLAREVNPEVSKALVQLASQAADVSDFVSQWIEAELDRRVRNTTEGCTLDTAGLASLAESLRIELVKRLLVRLQWPVDQMRRAHYERAAEILFAGGRMSLPQGIDLTATPGQAVLRRL